MTDAPTTSTVGPNDAASVMHIIQKCLNEMDKKHATITRDTRIDRYFLEVIGEDDLEYLDLAFRIESKTGVWLTTQDWEALTRIESIHSREEVQTNLEGFTFGRLAELVAMKSTLVELSPITIGGSNSLAAGAFQRIQEIIQECRWSIPTFAPSTPIGDRLHGRKLIRFWTLIRRRSKNRLPPLKRHPSKQWLHKVFGERGVSFGLGVSLAMGWLICRLFGLIGAGDYWLYVFSVTLCAALVSVLVGSILFLVLQSIFRVVMPREKSVNSRLPNNLRTFGDLARALAGERGGWCDKCGYDLTGLTSGRCPECGYRPRDATAKSLRGNSPGCE